MQKKPLIKFRTHLWLKTLQKKNARKTYLNIVDTVYDKPTANILNGEKLKAFQDQEQDKGAHTTTISLLKVIYYILIRLYLMVTFKTVNNWYIVVANHHLMTIKQIQKQMPT